MLCHHVTQNACYDAIAFSSVNSTSRDDAIINIIFYDDDAGWIVNTHKNKQRERERDSKERNTNTLEKKETFSSAVSGAVQVVVVGRDEPWMNVITVGEGMRERTKDKVAGWKWSEAGGGGLKYRKKEQYMLHVARHAFGLGLGCLFFALFSLSVLSSISATQSEGRVAQWKHCGKNYGWSGNRTWTSGFPKFLCLLVNFLL